MRTETVALNPFSLMMEPEMVLSAMEHSQQLRGRRRHKLPPLYKPQLPFSTPAMTAPAAFDADIDAAFDADMVDEAIEKYFHN